MRPATLTFWIASSAEGSYEFSSVCQSIRPSVKRFHRNGALLFDFLDKVFNAQ